MPKRPKSTALKIVKGEKRQSRLKDEPQPEGELGPPPKYLPKYQQAVWREEAKRFYWAAEAHRGAFEILVRNVARARKLAKELEKDPAMIKGSRGMVRNPKSYEQRECEDRAAKMYAEFGLTPAAQTRVKVPPEKTYNPAAEFFRDRGRDRTSRTTAPGS
ncbi:MAG: P27 family phage terminase small subunit [Acidobacteria bacterium]|nr:P27 family phage terminase small subunit [Acidobacteriota bacterium]